MINWPDPLRVMIGFDMMQDRTRNVMETGSTPV